MQLPPLSLAINLEGYVFVGDFRATTTTAHGLFGVMTAPLIEVITAAGTSAARSSSRGHAIPAPTQHPEIGGYDFKAGALLAFFILPFAGLNAAFDEYQRAFLQILLRDFRLLAPHHNLVPLGALLALPAFVFVGLIRSNGEIGDGLSAGSEAGFGIAAQTTDEDDFIH